MSDSLPAACLYDIAFLTSSTLTDVTPILMWWRIGGMIGTVIGGFLYDLISAHLLMGLSFLLSGSVFIFITMFRTTDLFFTGSAIAGVSAGLVVTGK